MTAVVFYGDDSEKVMLQIERILSKYGVATVFKSKFNLSCSSPQILLVQSNLSQVIQAESGIAVVVGNTKNCKIEIPNNFVGISFSADVVALKLFKANGVTALTCGMSGSDTLVLSGITENSASVCLQRKILALNGKIIEPAEYPLHLKTKITDYAILAAFGILLLSGIEPKDLYY